VLELRARLLSVVVDPDHLPESMREDQP